MSIIGNIIWIVFGGLFMALEYMIGGILLCLTIVGIPFGLQVIFIGGIWIALSHLVWGTLFCITIVGIPFGIQHFKLMSFALVPFGRTIIRR